MDPVEQVRQAANLVEIASQYTYLARRGRKHVGLCPFHSEKTPSFSVDEDKQLYHCFGCGAGGDVFTFIMEKESLSFPEALRFLADRYNIPLPDRRNRPANERRLEEQVYQINQETLDFFRRNLLKSEEGRNAGAYLERRGVGEDTIRRLRIGYAPNAWDGLLRHFQRRKISPALLEKAGLVLRRQRGDGFYDRFRGRVIFPIFSLSGKVVAFGGRTILDENPKYLNSPDTPVYTKGKILYGLNFTKGDIRDKGEMVLVEGYTDFLALFQAGITNVAASLGTSLTDNQATLGLRFAPRMTICYDSDTAGRKAAHRAVVLGFEKGLQVNVLLLPEGHDPDSFIRNKGEEEFRTLVSKSRPGFRFLIDVRRPSNQTLTPEEKARTAREVIQEIAKIPDAIIRSEYLKQTGEILDIEEKTLRSMTSRGRISRGESRARAFLPAEERLLQIIFSDSGIAGTVFKEMSPNDYAGLKSEAVFRALSDFFRARKAPDLNVIKNNLDAATFGALISILQADSPSGKLQEARECLLTLREYALSSRLKILKSKIQDLRNKGEQQKIPAVLNEIMDIHRHLYELSQRSY